MPKAGPVWLSPAIAIGRTGDTAAIRFGEVHAPAGNANAIAINIGQANNIGSGSRDLDLNTIEIKSQRVQRPGVRPWGPKRGSPNF